ncbi:MAG: hypothetical protein ACRDSL_05075 [Pseudonocardiaceae bacterium]
MGGGPFDDLYTAVYAVLDDAKAHHALVKLYQGSHGSADPHPVVLEFGAFFAARRCGVLSYACLTYLAGRQHRLGAYRGGSSGLDDESRACMAALFRQLGLVVNPDEVLIFCGGFKGALVCACAAVMSHRRSDELHHTGGVVLASRGYYQSLRLIPAIFGGGIDVVAELDGGTVADWLDDTRGRTGRIVYVPLVNNADGRVLCRERACGVAAAVLVHNRRHPGNQCGCSLTTSTPAPTFARSSRRNRSGRCLASTSGILGWVR